MAHILAGLLAFMQLLAPVTPRQEVLTRLRSGQWLRFHVIAQDDSDEMQRLKYLVRDAVQLCYTACAPQDAAMLDAAQALLPELTHAAEAAARKAGFAGSVSVSLDTAAFDDRNLGGIPIPAGEYPALVIRLGDARGRNWWGLLDPETALRFACVGETQDGTLIWDWSWKTLLAALLGLPVPDGA